MLRAFVLGDGFNHSVRATLCDLCLLYLKHIGVDSSSFGGAIATRLFIKLFLSTNAHETTRDFALELELLAAQADVLRTRNILSESETTRWELWPGMKELRTLKTSRARLILAYNQLKDRIIELSTQLQQLKVASDASSDLEDLRGALAVSTAAMEARRIDLSAAKARVAALEQDIKAEHGP